MIKRLIFPMVLLLIVSILGMGLGCAAPATPTPTATPTVTPKVTPTVVAPSIQSIKIHLAQVNPVGSATGVYVEKFKALLEESSGGKIKLDHYPGAQLFTADIDGYHAVGTGAVEMISLVTSVLSATQNRAWSIIDAPSRYFRDMGAFRAFWGEPAGGGYFRALLEKDGVKHLDHWARSTNLPETVITNKRPIKKVEDWKGLKIRSIAGREWQLIPFGASPIPIPNAEVMTALQTGMVDGVTVTVSGQLASGWDKIVKYCTVYLERGGGSMPTGHLMANLAWWNGLSDATKTMIMKALDDTERWHEEVWIPQNDAPFWKRLQASYASPGKEFYDMLKADPAEAERHRVIRANAEIETIKKSLPPEMFNLAEAKYLR